MQASVDIIVSSLFLNVGIFLFAEEQRYKPGLEGCLSTRHKFFMQKKIIAFVLYLHISRSQKDSKIT